MNLKKFISTISAVTIAASAFAGLAVTAGASEYSSPYTLDTDKGEVISTVLIGTAVTDEDGNIGSVTPEDFEEYTSSYNANDAFTSAIPTRDSTFADQNADKNIYATGYGMALAKSGSSTYTFRNAVTSGKIVLRGDLVNLQRQESIALVGEDAEGNAVTIFEIYGSNSNYGAWTILNNGTAITQTKNIIQERGYALTLDYVVVDIDNSKVSWKYDGIPASSNNDAVHSGEYTVDVTGLKVTGLMTRQVYTSASGSAPTFDNVALYTVEVPTPATYAETFTVNCVDGDNSPLAEPIEYDVSEYEVGSDYTYYYPAYIVNNGALYAAATAPTYGQTVKLETENDDATVTYSLSDYSSAAFQYADFNDTTIGTGAGLTATAFSNGKAGSAGSGAAIEAFSIAESGTYTAIIHAGCKQNDNSRTGSLLVNGNYKADVTYTNYGGTVNTIPDINVKEGDVISVTIPRGNYQVLDYVLFVKTGEYVPVAPSATKVTDVTGAEYTENDGIYAKAMEFRADANDGSFSKIVITVAGSNEGTQEISTTCVNGGSAVFGIILASDDTAKIPDAESISIELR
ncbi:MAG: hypothetical protein ACI4TH_00305 [Candidatus Ornithomonoglobus sp.]